MISISIAISLLQRIQKKTTGSRRLYFRLKFFPSPKEEWLELCKLLTIDRLQENICLQPDLKESRKKQYTFLCCKKPTKRKTINHQVKMN